MGKQEIEKSYFLAFCIEQYKAYKGVSGSEVAETFYRTGLAEYLTANFEVLHTQSRQWLIEEMDEYLKNR